MGVTRDASGTYNIVASPCAMLPSSTYATYEASRGKRMPSIVANTSSVENLGGCSMASFSIPEYYAPAASPTEATLSTPLIWGEHPQSYLCPKSPWTLTGTPYFEPALLREPHEDDEKSIATASASSELSLSASDVAFIEATENSLFLPSSISSDVGINTAVKNTFVHIEDDTTDAVRVHSRSKSL